MGRLWAFFFFFLTLSPCQWLDSLSGSSALQGSLCLSVNCESHLTGLAHSSPAMMRAAQQDAHAGFESVWGSEEKKKKRYVSVLCVFGLTCTPVREKRKKKTARGVWGQRVRFRRVHSPECSFLVAEKCFFYINVLLIIWLKTTMYGRERKREELVFVNFVPKCWFN